LFKPNELIKRLGDDVGLALAQDWGVSHHANLESQGQEEDVEHSKDRNQTSGQEPTTVPSHKFSHVGSPEGGAFANANASGANLVLSGAPRLPRQPELSPRGK
jgi:hypothetical protein